VIVQTDYCLNDCSECEAYYDCPDHSSCNCCTGPADSDNSVAVACGLTLCLSCYDALCANATCDSCVLCGESII
jgi:hypothetical protein